MKKVYSGLAVIVALVLIAAAVPLVSAGAWKADSTVELTNMLTETSKNSEASVKFLGIAEPKANDFAAEMQRVESSSKKFNDTVKAIDDLGPNTFDITGQYSSAKKLKDDLTDTLKDMQKKYDEQRAILEKEQKSGITVESATKYADISEDLSSASARFENLIKQL